MPQHKCDLGILSLLSCCPTGHSSVSSQDSSSDQSSKLRAVHTLMICSSHIPRHSDKLGMRLLLRMLVDVIKPELLILCFRSNCSVGIYELSLRKTLEKNPGK